MEVKCKHWHGRPTLILVLEKKVLESSGVVRDSEGVVCPGQQVFIFFSVGGQHLFFGHSVERQ